MQDYQTYKVGGGTRIIRNLRQATQNCKQLKCNIFVSPVVLLQTEVLWEGRCDFEYFTTFLRLTLS